MKYFNICILLKRHFVLFLLIILSGSSLYDLFSQNIQAKPSRQSSFEAFSTGNYEKAYDEFSKLLLTYSKDPLYKYYSGVCLVKLNRDPVKAVTLLQQALQGAAVIRSLPSDALFYLGRAQQMSGKYTEAAGTYNLYTEQVGKKAAREQRVPEFIQQCYEKKGLVTETEIKPAEIVENDKKYLDTIAEVKPSAEKIPQKEVIKQPNIKVTQDSVKRSTDKVIKDSENISDSRVYKVPEIQSDTKVVKVPEIKPDTVKRIAPANKKTVETFTFFEVLNKPGSGPDEKIAINPEVPAGLIYRIQIAVFRNPVSPAFFKGITPVYGFKISGTDKTSYYGGMFRRLSDAKKALAAVKAKGFRDAFIVALSGNKPVSSARAAILEKEWGKKPFINIVKSGPETPIDTVTPTLSFRVEVVRSLKPLKEDIIEGINKMAGNRGLDIQPLEDGNIVYLVGKFITFESASEYADLLIRNGYREARVVAWMGKKEIPVETARKLFDNLE